MERLSSYHQNNLHFMPSYYWSSRYCNAENQELCKAGCRGSNMSSAALVSPSTEDESAAGARVPPGTAFGLQRSLATGGSSGSFSSPPPFPLRNAGASCSDFDAGA